MRLSTILLLLLSYESVNFAKDNNDQCLSIDETQDCVQEVDALAAEDGDVRTHSHFYDEHSNVIIQKVNEAIRKYKPCSKNDKDCSCYADVIDQDLRPFRAERISKDLIISSASYGTRYKILSGKLYREERCMFPARCAGIEHFIRALLPDLADMDLVMNTRDWPQIHKQFTKALPVFSFSKTDDYHDIMYPAWSFWAGGPAITLHPTGIGRWDLERKKIMLASDDWQWSRKLSKGFFRGSRTSTERDNLVLLSRRHPELVDAQYTKNQAWKSSNDTLNMQPAQEVSFAEHCHYKYLFNFRGIAASFRFKHLFLCKSLVFHVGNEWNEFFYSAMKPWVHYVPLHSLPSEGDLQSILSFFMRHDDLAQQIAQRGYEFIVQHLSLDDVQAYWRCLLNDYQSLIDYKVIAGDDMKEL